jgi:hypothetical protein
VDTRPQGQIYKLLVDLKSGHIEEDISALMAAETQAYQKRYGKLQPALYERLQVLKDDEALPVAIWLTSGTEQSLAELQKMAFDYLAAKYLEAREAMKRFGKPIDVADPELRQRIENEYLAFLAAQIVSLGVGNAISPPTSGTSHAAPQVAGLVALLIHRNSALGAWPEAAKAIIMASATHNIIGPTIIVRGQGDLRDGAGAINAALADTVAQLRADASTTCQEPCWWGDYIDNSNFPVGTEWERNFFARKGDLVRVAIAWWANADTPSNNYSFDRLDTDLDLRIKGPNGQYVPNVYSVSWDNNYEMVEFVAPQTGNYRIAVHKVRADETYNFLGIAFVRLPRVYIPLVLKNYP